MKKLLDLDVFKDVFTNICNFFTGTNKKSAQFNYVRVPVSDRRDRLKR